MSGSDGRWAELSSQNERVVHLGESTALPTGSPAGAVRARWTELTSQRERLVDQADPEFQLAALPHPTPGMRLVAGAA